MEELPHMYALVCPGNGVGVDSDQRPAHMLRHVAYAVGPSSAEYFPATQAAQGEVVKCFPTKNAFPPSGPIESALQEQQAEMEELHGRFARLSALAKEVNLEKRTLSLLSHYQVDNELDRDKQGGGRDGDRKRCYRRRRTCYSINLQVYD